MFRTVILIVVLINTAFAQVKLFPVSIKGKWGYMDNTGKMIIPPQYNLAKEFNEGLAVVALTNLLCVIDETNKRIIDTGLYQIIDDCSEGLISVIDFKRKHFYVNVKGEKVIELPDDIYESGRFNEGVALVSKQVDIHETKFGKDIVTLGFKFAYINNKGQLLTDFIYDDADEMKDGVARVKAGEKFGLINKEGKEILAPKYLLIGDFYEDKAIINDNNKFGAIDRNGNVVIKLQFELLFDFSEGMAGVLQKELFGFINSSGAIVIQPQYIAIRPFAEGKAAVQKEGKWGFIDKNGNWVIRNVFDNATAFSEGLCAVNIKRTWGFIDATGRMVIPADYDEAGAFINGVAEVIYRDIPFYVNKRGEILPKLEK